MLHDLLANVFQPWFEFDLLFDFLAQQQKDRLPKTAWDQPRYRMGCVLALGAA
jgi:hypothetical protein